MSRSITPAMRRLRRLPIAACLAIALAVSTETLASQTASPGVRPAGERLLIPRVLHAGKAAFPARPRSAVASDVGAAGMRGGVPGTDGTTITVTNCDDSGAGSLRGAASIAVSGDTIDLATLACGRITLTTGSIELAQNDLTLIGPGAYQLAIDGNATAGALDRVFDHTGTGLLAIDYLTITNATYVTYEAGGIGRGGCIRSMGTVSLVLSIVSSCRIAQGGDNTAAGGGLYAANGLQMIASVLRDNVAYSPNAHGIGGAAAVLGPTIAKYSAITGNEAYIGGGLVSESANVTGGSLIDKTTISGNHAQEAAGMLIASHELATIRNSTISGNRAEFVIGGVYSSGPIDMQNSTVAFNEAASAVADFGIAAAGWMQASDQVNLQSSIIANNLIDLSDTPRDVSVYGTGSVVGNSNLVTHTDTPMPAGTLYADPMLHPLTFNGGLTRTHALMDGSPAIDAGNNSAGLVYDQRLLPRVVGANADIGSFERQGPGDSEFIFVDGFD